MEKIHLTEEKINKYYKQALEHIQQNPKVYSNGIIDATLVNKVNKTLINSLKLKRIKRNFTKQITDKKIEDIKNIVK